MNIFFRFLRPLKSYKPPANASEKFDKICESQAISSNDDVKLDEPNLRFQLLTACEEAFEHNVPNSLLYSIENIGWQTLSLLYFARRRINDD